MTIKTGNILVLVGIVIIFAIAIITATQSGTDINEVVVNARWWNWLLSGVGFVLAIGLIIKFSIDSKNGDGFNLKKAGALFLALALALGGLYL